MNMYADARGKVLDSGNPVPRLLGFAIAGLILIVLLFNCVVKVPTGSVSVLTLFGRVTGEVLPEGIHVINP
jgi:regulator of protease activity HflC (stomatin/prohibitin superfamily)